jgi:hypothetical protein
VIGARVRTRRRWPAIVFAVAALLVAVAWTVRRVVIRDQARAVPVDEAVDEFRATPTTPTTTSTTSPAATSPSTSRAPSDTTAAPVMPATSVVPSTSEPTVDTLGLVEPGVYRYRTTGGEQIDALGGTSHEYPAETTITVVTEGCGVRLRWDALRERREEWSLCVTADGIELQPDAVQFHEFYGQGEAEQLTCDRPVLLVPADGSPRDGVTLDCTLAEDRWAPRWEVLERSTRQVDGEPMAVRHVRMTIDDTDEYWEDQVADWYLAAEGASAGLPVEVSVVKSSRSPSIVGPVDYEEQYGLELVSLEPLR